jgi:hypothetical protein
LIEAGQPAEAESVFRADLEQHPNNGWSLLGLMQSIETQGRVVPSDLTESFKASWARSDTWIRGAVF